MMAVNEMNNSKFVKNGENKHASRLATAMKGWSKNLTSYEQKPDGLFGPVAIVKSGDVTINSKELDLEFTVPFDDDLEPNEAEIIVYNITDTTDHALKYLQKITIEAGYGDDTGVIFSGKILKASTQWEGVDRKTVIKCIDDVSTKNISSLTFKAGTKASYILKTLVNKTGIPIAIFKTRRDHTYKDAQTVDGNLMENIKKYSEVCGISTYVHKGKLYCRYVKEGDDIHFTVQGSTGMIDSPESFEEEQTAEDFKEIVKGYKIKMLLQHRMATAAVINLTSKKANGTFRVRKGQHTFNESEAITEIEVI